MAGAGVHHNLDNFRAIGNPETARAVGQLVLNPDYAQNP
jgi:hypothetical protein